MFDFRFPRFWLGFWIALQILVFAACVAPLEDMSMPVPFSFGDKLLHEISYFVLAGYASMLFASRRAFLLAIAGLFLLGVVIEGVQAFLPWRSADPRDVLANVLGLLAGGLLAWTPLAYGLRWLDGGAAADSSPTGRS